MRVTNNGQRATDSGRSGFTLVELLVVITIIAILIGLTAAAVMRVRVKADEVKNRNEVEQIKTALGQFPAKHGVSFVASRIILREDGRYGDNALPGLRAAEVASEGYLKQVWGRLAVAAFTGAAQPGSRVALPATGYHDWNGDGVYTPGDAGTYILEGDQCLVFFLGGVQRNGATMGFGANKSYPMDIVNARAEPPLVDFPTAQLRPLATSSVIGTSRYGGPPPNAGFLSFVDPYGTQPYLYFSSRGGFGGASNAYDLDCAASGVTPYYEVAGPPPTKFYGRDSFQVISAGRNKRFGPGGQWIAASGQPYSNATAPSASFDGNDDLSSFHDRMLGVGAN